MVSLYQYLPNRDSVIAAVANRHGHRVHHRVADLNLQNETTVESAVGRIAHALFVAHALDPALHAAFNGDLANHYGLVHASDDHDHNGHSGTKKVMVSQILDLPVSVRDEIQRSAIGLAAATVAEIVHAMAHAIVQPHSNHNPEEFEREAVSAALVYLYTSGQPMKA